VWKGENWEGEIMGTVYGESVCNVVNSGGESTK